MKNFFYQINKEYIKAFRQRISDRFAAFDIRSNTNFMKSLFREINELFQKMGGRTVSKTDIPQPDDFPDSDTYNRLINDISFDIDKLFTAQKLVEDDVNNLMNFNSSQRVKTFENLTNIQQGVYSLYVKNRQDLSGERKIEVNFLDSSVASEDSSDIFIDEDRGTLTLSFTSNITKPVDVSNVTAFFSGKRPITPVYPNVDNPEHLATFMAVGSHWKRDDNDAHFVDTKSSTAQDEYRERMIDDPDNNFGVGWCEFEAVETSLDGTRFYKFDSGSKYKKTPWTSTQNRRDELTMKSYIGDFLKKDPELLYLDYTNSFQGKYCKINQKDDNEERGIEQYKITIPFVNAPITNEVTVDFASNEERGSEDGGVVPRINWELSRGWVNEQSYPLVRPNVVSDTDTNDGQYVCMFAVPIAPTRLELILEYPGNQWQLIPFFMSHYVYSTNKNYRLTTAGSTVNLTLGKTYNVFVDAEFDEENEVNRAIGVLLGGETETM